MTQCTLNTIELTIIWLDVNTSILTEITESFFAAAAACYIPIYNSEEEKKKKKKK